MNSLTVYRDTHGRPWNLEMDTRGMIDTHTVVTEHAVRVVTARAVREFLEDCEACAPETLNTFWSASMRGARGFEGMAELQGVVVDYIRDALAECDLPLGFDFVLRPWLDA